MWPHSLSLLGCFVALAFTAPAPTPDEDRMVQPLSAVASGNYTVSFMPLLAVLVNMFPRIMSRMRVQPLTVTPQARKLEALWEWERASLCAMVESAAWANSNNPCYFYSCRVSSKSFCGAQVRGPEHNRKDTETVVLSSTGVDECTTLELRRCADPGLKYDFRLGRCQPMSYQEVVRCQQTEPEPPASLYNLT